MAIWIDGDDIVFFDDRHATFKWCLVFKFQRATHVKSPVFIRLYRILVVLNVYKAESVPVLLLRANNKEVGVLFSTN